MLFSTLGKHVSLLTLFYHNWADLPCLLLTADHTTLAPGAPALLQGVLVFPVSAFGPASCLRRRMDCPPGGPSLPSFPMWLSWHLPSLIQSNKGSLTLSFPVILDLSRTSSFFFQSLCHLLSLHSPLNWFLPVSKMILHPFLSNCNIFFSPFTGHFTLCSLHAHNSLKMLYQGSLISSSCQIQQSSVHGWCQKALLGTLPFISMFLTALLLLRILDILPWSPFLWRTSKSVSLAALFYVLSFLLPWAQVFPMAPSL